MKPGGPVWITGAASGIGLELSREFLRRGFSVLAIDRDERGLSALKKEASLLGLPLATLSADVGAGAAYSAVLESAASQRGDSAIFVNNAGVSRFGAFSATGLDVFHHIMRVNLDGVARGTHFALERMERAGSGLIINMASTAGLVPSALLAGYAASKSAIVGFTRSLQSELSLSRSPVRLCLVTPGFVDTPLMRQEGVAFPSWLRWTLAKPAPVARAIVKAALAGRREVTPDLGGRMTQRLYRWAPDLSERSARFLLKGLIHTQT